MPRCVGCGHSNDGSWCLACGRYFTFVETCRNGHPRTASNTYVNPTTGSRRCLVCQFVARRAAA